MKSLTNTKRGFTLIEILIVIGIIAILAAIVVVAVNPAKQFAQARNTTREAGVSTILNAIGQRVADNRGVFAGTFGTFTCPTIDVGTTFTIGTDVAADMKDLSCLVPTYIPTGIPTDPSNGTVGNTAFTVAVDASGRYTVCAPQHAESAIPGSAAYCLTR